MTFLSSPSSAKAFNLADALWDWLLASGVPIVLIIVVAFIARLVAGIVISRVFTTMFEQGTRVSRMTNAVVRKSHDSALVKAQHERRQQRADTLAKVSKSVVGVVIAGLAFVMILAELNVNIAPIIASLGVAGLAAGIGAQTVIKDVVAGVVMLFEDVVAVGDYVDLQFAEGTVENINLRITQVRGLNGVLWTVRNGEIISVGNFSRGLGTALVSLDISSEANDADVTEALTTVLSDVKNDPEFGPKMLDNPAVSGILSIDGARYQRRITANTVPGKQWEIERELRRRVRDEFTRRGIGFALPRFQESGSR